MEAQRASVFTLIPKAPSVQVEFSQLQPGFVFVRYGNMNLFLIKY